MLFPDLGDPALLDVFLLGIRVALLGGRDEARINDLAGHRDVACLADRQVKADEQRLDRPGLRQPLAERPDGLRIRHPVGQPEPEKAHEREPVVDQELGAVVAEIVLSLDDQDLEHHHRVERRPAALGAVAVSQRSLQLRPEHLEIHHRGERLELVADVAQPPQPFVQIEQSRLSRHPCLRSPSRQSESRNL
jgi:hypothetical protein